MQQRIQSRGRVRGPDPGSRPAIDPAERGDQD
jgi:hypothetical protein